MCTLMMPFKYFFFKYDILPQTCLVIRAVFCQSSYIIRSLLIILISIQTIQQLHMTPRCKYFCCDVNIIFLRFHNGGGKLQVVCRHDQSVSQRIDKLSNRGFVRFVLMMVKTDVLLLTSHVMVSYTKLEGYRGGGLTLFPSPPNTSLR